MELGTQQTEESMTGKPTGRARLVAARLVRWCDPEWLPGLAFLLTPALFCIALHDQQRASFFTGAAIYLSVMRWLGWALVTRHVESRLRYALFGVEFFAGLAAACAWFYLRNLVSRVLPIPYVPVNVRWVFYALLTAHALALPVWAGPIMRFCWRHPTQFLGDLFQRAAAYLPLCLLLVISLWLVAGSLNVQTTDSIIHAFLARLYRERGIFAGPFNSQPVIDYPTGFGVINAVTAAVAPLSVVQVLNLQHVLLLILALFAISGIVIVRVGRPMPLVHSLVLAFVAFFPLYGLAPDALYQANARQAGPALLTAAFTLPLLPLADRRGLWALAGSTAVLCLIAFALNPSCAPFAALTGLAVLILTCSRSKERWGRHAVTAGMIQSAAFLVAAVLVIGADPYYFEMVQGRTVRGTEQAPGGLFRVQNALTGLNPLLFVTFSPLISFTELEPLFGKSAGWTENLPESMFPAACLMAALAWMATSRRQRRAGWDAGRTIYCGLGLCLTFWFVQKLGFGSLLAGLNTEATAGERLKVYVGFLLLRFELLVLFATGVLTAVGFYLLAERAGLRRAVRKSPLLAAFAVLVCPLPLYLFLASALPDSTVARAGMVTMQLFPSPYKNPFDAVTGDDIRLVQWAEANLPGDQLIGLASLPFEVKTVHEAHMYPWGGAQAYPLYSRRYNFCFFMLDPHLRDGIEAYVGHVFTYFDPEWCLAHHIRYFYVTDPSLPENMGLAQAIRDGVLRRVQFFGSSSILEVRSRARPPGSANRPGPARSAP
jgi:hypothetical protein